MDRSWRLNLFQDEVVAAAECVREALAVDEGSSASRARHTSLAVVSSSSVCASEVTTLLPQRGLIVLGGSLHTRAWCFSLSMQISTGA